MKSPAFLAFVAILCVGGLVSGPLLSLLRVPAGAYWTAVFLFALLAAGAVAQGAKSSSRHPGGSGEFLCDSCRYNDGRYCSRPERPNATDCPEYRDRVSD
jgi:hypothetical protein